MGIPDDPPHRGGTRRRNAQSGPCDVALPASAAADSIEALAADRYGRAPVIYFLILAIVAIGCAVAPLVHVPVSIRATGLIRPSVEKHEIRAATSGVVADARLEEGKVVAAGEPLLRVSAPADSIREAHLLERRREIASNITDLERISSAGSGDSGRWEPSSSDLRAELRSTRSAAAEARSEVARIGVELRQAERLVGLGLLAKKKVHDLRFDLTEAEARLARIEADSLAAWARKLTEHRRGLREVDRELAELRANARFRHLTAPVAGTLESVVPVTAGSFVTAGERLATVSPRGELRVEAYVPAERIALVRPGDRAHLEVDGYDPGEWGLLPGRVLSVADDHVLSGDRAVFRIGIALERDHLRLPGGRIGPLRKGMTVEARILVARPSVYSLLRQSFTDWMDPSSPDR